MRRMAVVASLVLALAPITRADDAGAWRPLVIHQADQAPMVDGKLGEPCWQEADRRALRHYAGGELEVGGSAALCFDEENLYAALWLDEPAPAEIASAVEPAGMWDGEVIEWFICPSEDGLDYFQLAWNPAGRKFEAKCLSAGAGGTFDSNADWQAQWRNASTIGDGGWTTEAAIPLAEMGLQNPAEGALWRINLARHRTIGEGKPQWSTLSPTGAGGFHTIDRFEDVYFGKYVEAVGPVRGDGTIRALIGCWGPRYGYAAVFEPHVQLDRALGQGNVQMRTLPWFTGALANWPKRAGELAGYDLVVITDLPTACFSDKQLAHLRQYVIDGGRLVLMGSMGGWKHEPVNDWNQSPLGDMLPMPYPDPTGPSEVRRIKVTDPAHPLLRGLSLETREFTVWGNPAEASPDATVIATMDDEPFIAETRSGQGMVIQITGRYAQKGSQIPIPSFKTDFFMSDYYPVFWDNLVEYATTRPVLHPAEAPQVAPAKAVTVACDLITDNDGFLFAPGATVLLRPDIQGAVNYPYDVAVMLTWAGAEAMSLGRHTLEDADDALHIELPYLDRGQYALRLDVTRDGELVDSVEAPFAVTLPLNHADDFIFSVLVPPDCLGEPDMKRIAQYVKSIGFTEVFWLGGHILGYYEGQYRRWNRPRFNSIMQAAGLKTAPVWYPNLLDVVTGRSKAGRTDRTSGQVAPDPAFPGKEYLPYAHFWLEGLDRLYGSMPLADLYYGHDEVVGTRFPSADSDRFKEAFEAATGISASDPEATTAGAYAFMRYKTRAVTALVWLARAVSEAYAPELIMGSTISPMSLGSHTSAVLDVFGTASSLATTGPDVYHYGEPKLYVKTLGNMAIIRSATEFGRLSKPSFMGGQLNNVYYEDFPEQVFAALTEGARQFDIFAYSSTSFETNGRADERFAEIAERTTADATRIGRALNHYRRSRARVAMVYPNTAHMWMSMGQTFNDDYLALTGTSKQYIGLGGAMRSQYDMLRKMFGHVDMLFDEQIQRGDLRRYDVCVVGYARQVEARTLRELRRFAEAGGTLLVSSDSARLDEANQPTDILYSVLPASVGEERTVTADYSSARMPNVALFNRGNALVPGPDAELLFSFVDDQPACVRGAVGRGQAVVLGMPLASLRAEVHDAKRALVSYVLNKRARLISRPDDGEFSAITFLPERGDGRIFMVANHNKQEATTRVVASGDVAEAGYVLADIVTGESIPFAVEGDELSFEITCADRWGRALALIPNAPAFVEVSASPPADVGGKLMIAVRILGRDHQPVRSTLPFDLVVTEPDGTVRDDLSGARVAVRGVYAFAMTWPVNAKRGTWTVAASEKISGSSDAVDWQSR